MYPVVRDFFFGNLYGSKTTKTTDFKEETVTSFVFGF